jgi:serine/threonine-protein kinase
MIGTRLGPYTIEALLGTGGMGTVYRAAGPDGVVALKIVHPALLGEGGARERLAREAELGRRVQHGNVVRTLGSGEADGALFLVMEYVEGRTLDKLREELGAVPEELCRHIASEVAQGLAAVHAAGAVHRDLKPANVLVARDNTVKLMDLGVARLRDEAARMSRTGAFVGSVDYAAPEQFEGASDLDGRTDLHALGVLLYELATGRHPFRRDSLQGTMGAILNAAPPPLDGKSSPFFHAVVGRLLQKQRADRSGSRRRRSCSTCWTAARTATGGAGRPVRPPGSSPSRARRRCTAARRSSTACSGTSRQCAGAKAASSSSTARPASARRASSTSSCAGCASRPSRSSSCSAAIRPPAPRPRTRWPGRSGSASRPRTSRRRRRSCPRSRRCCAGNRRPTASRR